MIAAPAGAAALLVSTFMNNVDFVFALSFTYYSVEKTSISPVNGLRSVIHALPYGSQFVLSTR